MDRPEPVPNTSPNSNEPQPGETGKQVGHEAETLKAQVKQGNLAGLRDYLARTRGDSDWQDRVFMLNLIAPRVRLAALEFACDTEREASDLFLIRCCYYAQLAWTMRGSGTCDEVADHRFHSAAECIHAALADLEEATKLDSQDPTPYACILPSLRIFGQLQPHQQQAFQQAVKLAPDLVSAYYEVVYTLAKRWYGSHERSPAVCALRDDKGGPGSDMPACLFRAHMTVRTHSISLDKDRKEADRYLHDPEVNRELNAAFDSWTQPPYAPRRYSIPYLHSPAHWYYLAEDAARLKRVLELTGNTFSEEPWSLLGDPRKIYARALQIAAGEAPPPISGKRELWEDTAALVDRGANAITSGKFFEAGIALATALALAHMAPESESRFLIPLVCLNQSLLRLKQRKHEDSKKLREKATALLDANEEQIASDRTQRPLANVLYKLGEYRRALAFFEQAISQSEEDVDPFLMAEMLHKMGECYNQVGLTDHAAVPMRAALRIYEAFPLDPRLPGSLVSPRQFFAQKLASRGRNLLQTSGGTACCPVTSPVGNIFLGESWSSLL